MLHFHAEDEELHTDFYTHRLMERNERLHTHPHRAAFVKGWGLKSNQSLSDRKYCEFQETCDTERETEEGKEHLRFSGKVCICVFV